MDSVAKNKGIVKKYLQDFLRITQAEENSLLTQLVQDDNTHTYLVLTYGWLPNRFVHYVVFHFQIKADGKIWLFQNRTNRLIFNDVIALGASRLRLPT